MTAHLHTEYVDGCVRCDLSRADAEETERVADEVWDRSWSEPEED